LPALPKAWPKGKVTGLRARGSFEVEVAWADGRLAEATIKSLRGGPCSVRYNDISVELPAPPGQILPLDGDLGVIE
jgi:alpha-L-fucosidase 2